MKVISLDGGQVLQLFTVEEVQPLKGVFLPSLLREVANRYQFINIPEDVAKAQNGAKFQNGHIIIGDEDIIVRGLDIYNDGIIVIALNTTLADVVLDDFISWAQHTFKLREPVLRKPRTYVSSIVFEFDSAVEHAIEKFGTIATKMSHALRDLYGWDHDIRIQRFAFAAEPELIPQYRQTVFTFERRLQAPYERNRYISMAPITTDQHLTLLQAIESIFLGS